MSGRRTDYGERRYEVRVMIHGEKILLGYYRTRAEKLLAESVATTIRSSLGRAALIRKKEASL